MEEKAYEIMEKAGKPMRPGEIGKELGIESKEASKLITELKKQGRVYSPKRCYYAIKD